MVTLRICLRMQRKSTRNLTDNLEKSIVSGLTIFVWIKIDAGFEACEQVDSHFASFCTAQLHSGDAI
jgi:hypothetical protein